MAMSLMDPVGLRRVAASAALAAPLNVLVSILLAKRYGAPGPLLASCIVCALVQIIPIGIYAQRRERDTARGVGRHRVERKKLVEAGLLPETGPDADDFDDQGGGPGSEYRPLAPDPEPLLEAISVETSAEPMPPVFARISRDDPNWVEPVIPIPRQRGFVPREEHG
jgi:hypothetical protein